MVTAFTAKGMTIWRLFVVQALVGTTHGGTQYSVNKIIQKYIEPQTVMRQKLSDDPGNS